MTPVTDLVPDSHLDILKAPLTAVLTTVDGRGRPQSTAVWYMLDQGELKSSTTSDRQKYRNLVGNPNCSLFVLDPGNSHRTLELRAEAELSPDPDKSTVRALARAYGGDEEAMVARPEERWTITYRLRKVVGLPSAAH